MTALRDLPISVTWDQDAESNYGAIISELQRRFDQDRATEARAKLAAQRRKETRARNDRLRLLRARYGLPRPKTFTWRLVARFRKWLRSQARDSTEATLWLTGFLSGLRLATHDDRAHLEAADFLFSYVWTLCWNEGVDFDAKMAEIDRQAMGVRAILEGP